MYASSIVPKKGINKRQNEVEGCKQSLSYGNINILLLASLSITLLNSLYKGGRRRSHLLDSNGPGIPGTGLFLSYRAQYCRDWLTWQLLFVVPLERKQIQPVVVIIVVVPVIEVCAWSSGFCFCCCCGLLVVHFRLMRATTLSFFFSRCYFVTDIQTGWDRRDHTTQLLCQPTLWCSQVRIHPHGETSDKQIRRILLVVNIEYHTVNSAIFVCVYKEIPQLGTNQGWVFYVLCLCALMSHFPRFPFLPCSARTTDSHRTRYAFVISSFLPPHTLAFYSQI